MNAVELSLANGRTVLCKGNPREADGTAFYQVCQALKADPLPTWLTFGDLWIRSDQVVGVSNHT